MPTATPAALNPFLSDLLGRRSGQGRDRGVDPWLDVGVSLLLVFARLQQAVQFVGVPGAPGFERLASLVLGDSGRGHLRRRRWQRRYLIRSNYLVAGCGDVTLGQVWEVGGAGLLAVVPQREERGLLRVAAFHSGDHRGDDTDTERMVGDRFR
jgi:hypothetical protein